MVPVVTSIFCRRCHVLFVFLCRYLLAIANYPLHLWPQDGSSHPEGGSSHPEGGSAHLEGAKSAPLLRSIPDCPRSNQANRSSTHSLTLTPSNSSLSLSPASTSLLTLHLTPSPQGVVQWCTSRARALWVRSPRRSYGRCVRMCGVCVGGGGYVCVRVRACVCVCWRWWLCVCVCVCWR